MWWAIAAGGALVILLLPIAPINSTLWNNVSSKIYDFREEVGWQDFVDRDRRGSRWAARRRACPYRRLRQQLGEAGAIDLYGPARGSSAISGMNSYWYRGHPDATITTLIVSAILRSASKYVWNPEVAGKSGTARRQK